MPYVESIVEETAHTFCALNHFRESLHRIGRNMSASSLNPPFALDYNGSDDCHHSPGYRSGGPKEARIKRVALLSKTKEIDHLHSVKVGNLPRTVSAENLLEEFSELGEVGDVYIPVNLKDKKPAKDFAVIRFMDKKVADASLSSPEKSMMLKTMGGSEVFVSPITKQGSFFSNNTGRLGISNEVVISHVPPTKERMVQKITLAEVRSRAGYPWGSVRELKFLNPKPSADVLEYHSIKLVDLPRHIK